MVKIIRPTKKVKITQKEAPVVEVDVLMHESLQYGSHRGASTSSTRKRVATVTALLPFSSSSCQARRGRVSRLLYRGRDPYDTTKKMKKDGEYLISPTYGTDPLYRGYALPGQRILAMREEEEDLRREEQEEADQWEA